MRNSELRCGTLNGAWGPAASPDLLASGNRAFCDGAACVIWDVSLAVSDQVLRARNGAFSSDSPCSDAVDGQTTITDQLGKTFLVNAIELMADGLGDDDGLCESDEACTFSPNFGAYQGHGDPLDRGTCTFEDGTVTGVHVYAYPRNGR